MDLHIQCPCNTHIYYNKKKCDGCLTYLDKDHRTGENAVEHVFIRKLPKEGIFLIYLHNKYILLK